ncbi:restriction endonuclease subunit S [Mycetocola saprophilus]|uniref:restriction endonuclease subunit S n=1 Tax=Mycetocola saprophilus TaxID=76636 RepID=UPI003BF09902
MSDDDWIGQLPLTWATTRLGALGTFSKGSGGSKEDNRDTGVPVIRYGELYSKFDRIIREPVSFIDMEASARYTPLSPGSLIFAASGEDSEEIGKSALSQIPAPAFVGGDSVIFTPRVNAVDPVYLTYVLDSKPLRSYKAIRATGFTVVHISANKLKTLPIPLPSSDEQRVIVEYLDQETAQIDALVARQKEFVVLLRERRRAALESAVTGVKPSGPRLKHVVRSVRQGWSPQCYAWPADGIEKWAVLKAGAANGGVFRQMENKELPAGETPRLGIVVRAGDLVVSRANTRDLVGSAAVVDRDYPRLMLSDKLYAFDLDRSRALPHFVAVVLGSRRWRDLIEIEATGTSSSMLNISQNDIVNLPMSLPAVHEQRSILAALDAQISRIDTLIAKAEEHIALAKERRAALITAAVTGQFDVRTAIRGA